VHTEIASVRQGDGGLIAKLRHGDGSEREYSADAICMGYGFMPSHELLRALGARFEFDAARGYLVPRRDRAGETSIAGVYSVGDCTGIGGARVAMAEGTLAGIAVAGSLGRAVGPLTAIRVAAEREAGRQRRFQNALWSMYATPRAPTRAIPDAAIVCRCESVTAGSLRAAIAAGCADAGELKRVTRAGMGRCQARYCGSVVTAALAEDRGIAPGEYSSFAPRVPVKPLDIATLRPPVASP
jgi:NAD(P)H-nitrite reductase large subunit